MLTPEQSKEELNRRRNPKAREELSNRLTALRPDLSSIGLAFLEAASSGFGNANQDIKRKRLEAHAALERQTDGDRRALFTAMFPSISEHVEASWKLQITLPYQTGYTRKAFRAPNDRAYTARARAEWLEALLKAVLPYRYDLDFLTVWAPHLSWGAEHPIGLLLAGVLDSQDRAADETLRKLISIVNGEHETARIGRYAVTALLSCSNRQAWAAVERLLLAAQRQEGLRQVVMESIDFANAEAYRRMLQLILQEKLSRFAAVARGVAVWFGLSVDSAQTKTIDSLLEEVLENLSDDSLRSERIRSAKNQSLYLALWASAFIDVVHATQETATIAQEPDFERRYAAVYLLSQLWTTVSARLLVQALFDSDLRIALRAAQALPHPSSWTPSGGTVLFDALRELVARTPEDKPLEPAIWEWNRLEAKQSEIAAKLIIYRGDRGFEELAPHVPQMDATGRAALLRSMLEDSKKTGELKTGQRDLAFSLLSDASNGVRELAFQALRHAQISTQDAELMEPLLARKASDLRRGVMRLLLKQPTAGCRASIERLKNSGDKLMQQAAEELGSELDPEAIPAASIQDGFGLFDPEQRTLPVKPRPELQPKLVTSASEILVKSLDALIDSHRETNVTITGHYGETIHQLLGNLKGFGKGDAVPLWEVWTDWWRSHKEKLGGSAEFELVRAFCIVIILAERLDPARKRSIDLVLFGIRDEHVFQLKFRSLCYQVMWRLLAPDVTADGLCLMLDILEACARVISNAYTAKNEIPHARLSWGGFALAPFLEFTNYLVSNHPGCWTPDIWKRYWGLRRFIDEGVPNSERKLPPLQVTLEAHRQLAASEADIYEQLLTTRQWGGDLRFVTTRQKSKLFETYPELEPIVEKIRDRILEIELRRGDLPTPASPLMLQLRSVFGAKLALRILKQLGKELLERGYLRRSESKPVVFSHLLRVSVPTAHDTLESFTDEAKRLEIPKKRLVDLAVYAPQWAKYVEHATGIVGLQEAALWLHAHTKDTQWTVEEQIRELWFAELSERTALTKQELLDGAVDVDWFVSMRSAMKEKEWAMMLDSAKYASGGGGHKRAGLFASALMGEVTRERLSDNVTEKRNQDSVRAIGLLPLPSDEAERRNEVLTRYEILQRFLRESKKFGAQRQTSEKLACSTGLANLARTAGYPDPQRLSWAMEAEASADLRSGPLEATDGALRGVLSINALGEPELLFEKNGKVLKDLPAAMKKSPALSTLRSRKSQLLQQASRMRQSLEEAMIRGDRFTTAELRELEGHPLLRPIIASLVFTNQDCALAWGNELNGSTAEFHIAHPVDLLRSGNWPHYQKQCLELSRIQPFKQLFREVYLLTETERQQHFHSGRYEGQQVNPKQALTVAGKRGWVNVPEEGLRKTFHHDNVSAWVTFFEGWFTPAEVDGLTVQQVLFTKRSEGKKIPLEQVNARVFSEAMRDLDLMVSVAHRGGVDPEATASTVDMRAALIRETVALLKMTNVRLNGLHAFVDGKIGQYNIHLGSGTVHRQPGGSLCIIPVHSQHRGRLFLPFADDDPKTAEIVSKVLLLAQDEKIKDPTILEQLR